MPLAIMALMSPNQPRTPERSMPSLDPVLRPFVQFAAARRRMSRITHHAEGHLGYQSGQRCGVLALQVGEGCG